MTVGMSTMDRVVRGIRYSVMTFAAEWVRKTPAGVVPPLQQPAEIPDADMVPVIPVPGVAGVKPGAQLATDHRVQQSVASAV